MDSKIIPSRLEDFCEEERHKREEALLQAISNNEEISMEDRIKRLKRRRLVGNQNERYVQKYYEDNGFLVHRAYASTFIIGATGKRATRSHDVFGLFDIIAKKKGSKNIYVQVSTGSRKAEKAKEILKYDIWNTDLDILEIWLAKGRGEWEIFRYRDRDIAPGFYRYAHISRKRFMLYMADDIA